MTPATFQNPDRIDNAVQESSPLLGDREQAAPSKKMLLSRNLFGGARALFTQVRPASLRQKRRPDFTTSSGALSC